MTRVRDIHVGRAILLLASVVLCPMSWGQNEAKPLTEAEVMDLLRNYVRIPGQGEEDSGMNAKSVPERRQTRFRAEGEQ